MKDKVEIKHQDVRQMSFTDNSLDVIFSLLCLHNIEDKEERALAYREIARVLKPGGTALIADYTNISEYAKALAQVELKVEKPEFYLLQAYGLMWMVIATKDVS